jgi:hypothetical protein
MKNGSKSKKNIQSPQSEINGLCYLLRSNCNNVDVGAPKERLRDRRGLGRTLPSELKLFVAGHSPATNNKAHITAGFIN